MYLMTKYALSQYAVNPSPPATPTNFVAVGIAPNQLELEWMSASTNVYSFHVERAQETNGPFQEIWAVSGYVTNFVDTTASPGTTNYYRVKAHNLFGDSAYSTVISPPAVSLTSWPAIFLERSTNWISAQAGDAFGSVNSVSFLANLGPIATVTTPPYTLNWLASMEGPRTLCALAVDSLGNSQYSTAITVTVYLDSNGDGIPDITQVISGNDPMNPWVAQATLQIRIRQTSIWLFRPMQRSRALTESFQRYDYVRRRKK